MQNIKEEIIKIRNLPLNFFNPIEYDKYNANLIKNINEAKNLFKKYLSSNNQYKISIVADPDIDGIMATMIMYGWLSNFTNPKLVIHQRHKGHGVLAEEVKKTDLLIIVDSSSNSVREIKKIFENKLAKDILIIDHHETENVMVKDEEIPSVCLINGVTLINVHQPYDLYPNKELSGAMTVYKVLEYLEETKEFKPDKSIEEFSDLGAISIISDVMSVKEMENRYYYYNGLRNVKNRGILLLMRKIGVFAYKVNSHDLAFKFNKAINSLLRLGNIYTIFNLLLCEVDDDIEQMIENIMNVMKIRDNIENNIMENLTTIYENDYIGIYQNNYDNEILAGNFSGVIASKICDKKNINVFIVNNKLTGSARALEGCNLKDFINNSDGASGVGHQGAFGIKITNLDKLIEYLNHNKLEVIASNEYDISLMVRQISKDMFKDLKDVQYLTGKGFSEIGFKIEDVEIIAQETSSTGKRYYIIKDKDYLRIYMDNDFVIGDVLNIYCTMELSNFFGKEFYNCFVYNVEFVKHNEVDINEIWEWE